MSMRKYFGSELHRRLFFFLQSSVMLKTNVDSDLYITFDLFGELDPV